MLSESQLSTLLNKAARAHATSKSPYASLLPFFVQTTANELSWYDLRIWQIDTDRVQAILSIQPNDKFFSISDQSLRNLETGQVNSFSISGGHASSALTASLCSLPIADGVRLAVAAVHSPQQPADEDVIQIAEVVADIRRRELLQKLLESNRNHTRMLNFVMKLHEANEIEELQQIFVTDGAAISGFDRISLASRQSSGGWDLVACTGTDTLSSRSEEVQKLRSMVMQAEAGNATNNDVLPLSTDGSWSTANYAAIFETNSTGLQGDRTVPTILATQMAMALAFISDRSHQRLRKRRNRRFSTKTGIALALLTGLGLIAILFQTEFKIRVYGQAVPAIRQKIFAPDSGIIQVLHVKHGQTVEKGTVLCEIHSDGLKVQHERTREQLVIAEARLAALQTLSQRGGGNSLQPNGALPPSVEQAELTQKIESLTAQVQLIEEQIASLQVIAPFRGEVYHERMQEELPGRPVQQGQYLFQIAAADGPWELQLHIPENEMRYVQAAHREHAELPLSFALETAPETELLTTIIEIGETAELDLYGTLSTQAVANIDKDSVPQMRMGAGVLGKIHCGTRPLMFLMTRSIRDVWARYSPF